MGRDFRTVWITDRRQSDRAQEYRIRLSRRLEGSRRDVLAGFPVIGRARKQTLGPDRKAADFCLRGIKDREGSLRNIDADPVARKNRD
jgi:hypothetical protein